MYNSPNSVCGFVSQDWHINGVAFFYCNGLFWWEYGLRYAEASRDGGFFFKQEYPNLEWQDFTLIAGKDWVQVRDMYRNKVMSFE